MEITMTAMRNLYCLVGALLLLCLVHTTSSANVRGSKMEELKERVLHPTIKPEHRGKTLQEIVGPDATRPRERKLDEPSFGRPTYSYFAVSNIHMSRDDGCIGM